MAKKKSGFVDDSGGQQLCPKCGKKCLYFKQYDCGDFLAVHSIIKHEVQGKKFSYKADKMGECCDQNGSIRVKRLPI